MKRLALVLAVATLGTGCIVVDDDDCVPTLTLDWSFRSAEGGVTTSCATAGVEVIDVWVNGVFVARFDCFGPAQTIPLARGTNDLSVEGIDAQGRIAYRDWFSFEAGACGHHGTLPTQPAEGFLEVDYAFSPVNACTAPPSYLWLEVHDRVAAQTAFVESGTAQPCSVTAPAPRYRLPVGAFTLVGIEEVVPLTGGGFGVVGADCTPLAFEMGAGATTVVSPLLVDAVAGCF